MAKPKRYTLIVGDQERDFYYLTVDGDGWRWHWVGTPTDAESLQTSDPYPTRVQALLEAANDAEDTIGDLTLGANLARRLRTAAALIERQETTRA